MGALLRTAGRCCGLSPLARLRIRLWLGRRVHGAIAGARAAGACVPRPLLAPALVLLYHRLARRHQGWEPTRPLAVPADLFRAQMEELRASFEVVPLDRLLDPPSAAGRPRAAVTFDDGYRDNLELGHPVLEELGIPAAVFVTTRWLGEEAPFWWFELEELARRGALGRLRPAGRWAAYAAQVSALKPLSEGAREERLKEMRTRAGGPAGGGWAPPVLSAADLRAMDSSGLWTVGGHTHAHTILSRMPLETARVEVLKNKRLLEEALGHPVRWFAYPNGGAEDFGPEHAALLREAGYSGALTGISPWEEDGRDLFRFPRLAVSGLEGLPEFKNHLAGIFWPR